MQMSDEKMRYTPDEIQGIDRFDSDDGQAAARYEESMIGQRKPVYPQKLGEVSLSNITSLPSVQEEPGSTSPPQAA